ncbi:MAG: DUF2062 domain-containing protein [Ghiorsea sp.]|nr:DUF2062 domain-containing protein [Ghiorsea sp.]
MPRKLLKKYMPDPQTIKHNKCLKVFGSLLHHAALWHFNRHTIAKAFAIGLFCAWVPIPFQMVLAAGLAILFNGNLPMSAALVWITNPFTMPPMFYLAYKVGAMVMGLGESPFEMELTLDWLIHGTLLIWKPFLLGCFIMAMTSSLLGYFGIQIFWRWAVMRRWKQRKDANTPTHASHKH